LAINDSQKNFMIFGQSSRVYGGGSRKSVFSPRVTILRALKLLGRARQWLHKIKKARVIPVLSLSDDGGLPFSRAYEVS